MRNKIATACLAILSAMLASAPPAAGGGVPAGATPAGAPVVLAEGQARVFGHYGRTLVVYAGQVGGAFTLVATAADDVDGGRPLRTTHTLAVGQTVLLPMTGANGMMGIAATRMAAGLTLQTVSLDGHGA